MRHPHFTKRIELAYAAASIPAETQFVFFSDRTSIEENTGSTTREVQRYCAIPAQACSYKIGHTYWNTQRDRARKALGARFDIKAFHRQVLQDGSLPLDVLEEKIDRWVSAGG